MKTYRESFASRNPLWIGVGTVAVIAAILLTTVGLAELGIGRPTYHAEFANTGGLRINDPVKVAGMDVGKVTVIRLEGGHVLVDFRLDRNLRIGANSTATMKLTTLLGGRYLALNPAGDGELRGRRITLAHTQVPFDVADFLQKGTPLFEQLDTENLAQSLRMVTANFGNDRPRIDAALVGAARLGQVVTTRKVQISQLINNADTVAKLLNERNARFFGLLGQSDALLGELYRRKQMLRDLLSDASDATSEIRALLQKEQHQFGPTLRNLSELSDAIAASDKDIDHAVELLGPAARYLTNSFGNGPYWEAYLPYSLLPDNALCLVGLVKGCK
ncbi:MAG TPA: MlaD family protein [Pseudonocardia sp.]|jgi:phospholipid/cholesterol/gamma-HCH transport system substrate-binding protein